MPRSAKHDEYSSFSKRETPIAPEYINSALRSPKAGESKCATKNVCSSFFNRKCLKTQNTTNNLRSQSMRDEERYIQNNVYTSHTNRESTEKHAKDNACSSFRQGNAQKSKAQ